MEEYIGKLAHDYYDGFIDYVDEKFAPYVIQYMEDHPEEFNYGYKGM